MMKKKYAHELLKAIDRHAQIVSVKDLSKLCDELRNAVIVITERYHGAIPALVLDIPVTIISQCAGDKLDQLKEYASAKKSVSELQEKAKYGENALKNTLDDLVKR